MQQPQPQPDLRRARDGPRWWNGLLLQQHRLRQREQRDRTERRNADRDQQRGDELEPVGLDLHRLRRGHHSEPQRLFRCDRGGGWKPDGQGRLCDLLQEHDRGERGPPHHQLLAEPLGVERRGPLGRRQPAGDRRHRQRPPVPARHRRRRVRGVLRPRDHGGSGQHGHGHGRRPVRAALQSGDRCRDRSLLRPGRGSGAEQRPGGRHDPDPDSVHRRAERREQFLQRRSEQRRARSSTCSKRRRPG